MCGLWGGLPNAALVNPVVLQEPAAVIAPAVVAELARVSGVQMGGSWEWW
jgi:hypothetical protein